MKGDHSTEERTARLLVILLALVALVGLMVLQASAADMLGAGASAGGDATGDDSGDVSPAERQAIVATGLTNMYRAIYGPQARDAADATTGGVCSNDKSQACNSAADCGGAPCYLPTDGGAILENQECMEDNYLTQGGQGGGLNCTANDINIAATTDLVITDGCDFPGDTATISFVAQFNLSATARHDVGVYLAEDGGDALNGSCAIATFPTAPDPPWVDLDEFSGSCSTLNPDGDAVGCENNGQCKAKCDQSPDDPIGTLTCANDRRTTCTLDSDCDFGTCSGAALPGDACGDINTAHNPLYSNIQDLTITCVDTDGDGFVDLNTCLSWRQPGSNEVCNSPTGSFPGAPSKCKCDALPGLNVPVPGGIVVKKVTLDENGAVITNDNTQFNFDITNVTGTDANFPDNFNLTGNPAGTPDNDIVYSPVDSPETYNLVENGPPSGWNLLTAVCVSNQGNPDQNLLSDSNFDLATGETQTCTFTNQIVTAVTVGYVYAASSGDEVEFTWQTLTETGTAGFNVLVEKGGQIVQLNQALIPSKVVDSVVPTDYAFTAKTDATVYYLDEIDVEGKTTRYGPYDVGVEYGSYQSTYSFMPIYLPLIQS